MSQMFQMSNICSRGLGHLDPGHLVDIWDIWWASGTSGGYLGHLGHLGQLENLGDLGHVQNRDVQDGV